MNIQFNIMGGLKQVRKSDFVDIFIKKFPRIKKKDVEKELTAVNRDYGIILYHNKGFLVKFNDLKISDINFGTFICSFNIDKIEDIITVGGNFNISLSGKCLKNDAKNNEMHVVHTIHPNIYVKYSSFNLPHVIDGKVMRICLYGRQITGIQTLINLGQLYAIVQIVKNMFNNNEAGDGLWDMFPSERCKICDDLMKYDYSLKCHKCRE